MRTRTSNVKEETARQGKAVSAPPRIWPTKFLGPPCVSPIPQTSCASAVALRRCVRWGLTPAERGFKIGVCEWMLGKNDPSSLGLAKQIGVDDNRN